MATEGRSTTGEDLLGERPAEDKLTVDVAQARVAAQLFGVNAQVVVGRYRLLELAGRGGMGVVWAAWDPGLERRVAVKLVDPLRSTARDRILGEGRALARLSHPNVVPVHDVGAVDDRVYLVMEWVTGNNLRVHLAAHRTVHEIVDVFTQAARGLAAVHAAGFVHRDFKPENAIVGSDGRVRILDFGLAWSDVDGRAREIAGTPRYMAPEQAAGEPPTPAVDQYALCVALREALDGRGAAIPAWLMKIIARGTAPTPDDRFTSIDELLRALGRDPSRVRRRRLAVAGAAAVAVASYAIGYYPAPDPTPRPCATAAVSPPGWSPGSRTAIAAHLGELGGFAASEQPWLVRVLDERARAWRTANRTACLAFAGGQLTAGLYERQLACLARAGTSLVTTAELLAGATAETFPDARVAAGALQDPSLCDRVDASLVAPPAAPIAAAVQRAESEAERARMLTTAARPDAAGVATLARTRAEVTGYGPAISRALLVEGRAQMLSGDTATAGGTLERATQTALAARDDATAVEAFARRAYVAAIRGDRVVDGATVIQAIARRLGPDGAFARLLLLNNLAGADYAAGDRNAARALLEAALREWRPGGGENAYELASIPESLALLVDRPADSLDLLARARQEVMRVVGQDHPKVSEIEQVEAVFTGDLSHARALQDAACGRLARLFPHLRHQRAVCEYDAGWLADEAGDAPAARAHFVASGFDPAVEPVRATIERGLTAPASAEVARSLEAAAGSAAADGSPWVRVAAADAYIAAARTWQAAGGPDHARHCWSRALPLLEATPIPAIARRIARVRAQLARMSPRESSDLARAAIAWYRSVGGYDATIAALARDVSSPD